ncbi:ABC transporter permease [Mumia zhuanghuii]|uniref:ABC transporter permease n=1 Tax=Mumia zhuanghuii TaxID=2585211 RepID=A0A5C4MZL9_9ACTN|nr:ABC transporter permease [Mumia zhuanghuii]TNC51744.1 ABC transporter permease [Mumia zhuanghuii]TNC52144.1 ABC transporter permease [Mumia zhuanghuii]
MRDSLTGTPTLVRFALRRSGFSLLWWIVGITALYPIQALALEAAYPTQADLDQLAASLSGNAAIIAMAGPEYALDTIGGQTAWQTSAFGAILAGLMSTFLIVRQTRAGEENGADELIRAGVVGRSATDAAAVVVTTAANLALVVAIAVLLIACGLPAEGSWALGCACGFTGMVFMGLALIFTQVSSTTRGAWGMSGAAIGLAYALRAAGDVGENALTWLSPIGWGQQMRAYADERWWPALLLLGTAVVSVAVARMLHLRRDFGAGLVAPRRGPATRDWRGGAYELAWRLQRPTVIGWLVGLAFGGAAYGTIGNDVGDLVGDSDLSGSLTGGQTGGDALTDGFYGSAMIMLAIITAAFGVAVVLRARGEETSGRVEPLLATALHRRTYLASHVAIAVLASTVGVALAGAATGWMYGVVSGSYDRIGQLTWAGLTYAPAIWVMIGLTVVLVGFLPRLASWGWLGIGYAAVVMFFGPLLKFPDWLMNVSPFTHLALVPLDDVAWAPILWLTVIAVALMAAGFLGFRRRDVVN